LAPFIAPKGSVAMDGVSLTVNTVTDQPDGTAHFTVNIIPHTAQWTTFDAIQPGDSVNIEIDTLARYLSRMQQVVSQRQSAN
jgi:riboflavin synthase